MSWNPPPPNVTDYYNFLIQEIKVPAQDLPPLSTIVTNSQGGAVLDSSGREINNSSAAGDWVNNTLAVALAMVDCDLQVGGQIFYNLCVYNYAADRLLNFAQDLEGQTFFEQYRHKNHLNDQVTGLVQSAGNDGQSTSLLNPEQMQTFTVTDLQMMKTVPGRTYIGLVQSTGTLWGAT